MPKPLNRNRLPKWARPYGADGESPVVVFTRMARRVPGLEADLRELRELRAAVEANADRAQVQLGVMERELRGFQGELSAARDEGLLLRRERDAAQEALRQQRRARESAVSAAGLAEYRHTKAEAELEAVRKQLALAKEGIAAVGKAGTDALDRARIRHRSELHAVAGFVGVVCVLVGAVATALVLAAL